MYYSTLSIVEVDPWERSIVECHRSGLTRDFLQSDYLPRQLPIDGRTFDLAYAFSVFTIYRSLPQTCRYALCTAT
jgi:hypothetical protein